MKSYYQDDYVTIYHGDCREIMPTLGAFNLVLTSPPYNIGNTHHNGNTCHSPYGDDLPETEYQAQQIAILKACYDSSSSVFYNHKNRIIQGEEVSPRTWICATPWKLRQTLVWENGGPNHDPIRFWPKTERIYWLVKPDTPHADNKKYTDVLRCIPDAGKLGKGHNCTFPVELAMLLMSVLPWAQTILDPFAGSGTTGRAAKDLNRQAVLIEKEEKYCEIAANRMRQEVLPLETETGK